MPPKEHVHRESIHLEIKLYKKISVSLFQMRVVPQGSSLETMSLNLCLYMGHSSPIPPFPPGCLSVQTTSPNG